jgi:hypothetical protein
MKFAVEISYRTVLMLNEREAKMFIDLISTAKLYEKNGYGQDALYKPTNDKFNIVMVDDNQLVTSFEQESSNENN